VAMESAPAGEPDVAALTASGRRVRAATDADLAAPVEPIEIVEPAAESARGDRAVGIVVHRLFQRRLDPSADRQTLTAAARTLVDRDSLLDGADPDAIAGAAVGVYQRLAGRADVAALLGSGQTFFEVPVSFVDPDRPGDLVRGVVDCLVLAPDGTATVVEFKTGTPRPAHGAQAGLYARAMAAALGAPVGVKILYA